MKTPSTEWKETFEPDEALRFARQGKLIEEIHRAKNLANGKGRFLHRKTILGAKALLTVHDNLPVHAQQGLFADPGQFHAVVRLSPGSFDLQANTKPDIQGFAFKVLDLSGPAALGGTADHQDFLLINHEAFASQTSDDFLEITLTAAAKGELGLIRHFIKRYGLVKGLGRVRQLVATLGKPFQGYNAETFSTAAPVAMGPYAAKVRLRPLAPVPRKNKDPRTDIANQLGLGPLSYSVEVQFFTDEATTPIENPPVVWPEGESPFLPVATLTILPEKVDVETLTFDPWGGLAAHRPLGEIMRSRKGAYYISQKARDLSRP